MPVSLSHEASLMTAMVDVFNLDAEASHPSQTMMYFTGDKKKDRK